MKKTNEILRNSTEYLGYEHQVCNVDRQIVLICEHEKICTDSLILHFNFQLNNHQKPELYAKIAQIRTEQMAVIESKTCQYKKRAFIISRY